MTSLAILIAKDWFALATIILFILIDRSMQPCESLRFNRCSSFAFALEDFTWFVAIFVAVEHAMVPATLVAYELACA
jgi:hypothetical protein